MGSFPIHVMSLAQSWNLNKKNNSRKWKKQNTTCPYSLHDNVKILTKIMVCNWNKELMYGLKSVYFMNAILGNSGYNSSHKHFKAE